MTPAELAHGLGITEGALWIIITMGVVFIALRLIERISTMNREEKTPPVSRDRNWQQQDGRDVIERAKQQPKPEPKKDA